MSAAEKLARIRRERWYASCACCYCRARRVDHDALLTIAEAAIRMSPPDDSDLAVALSNLGSIGSTGT